MFQWHWLWNMKKFSSATDLLPGLSATDIDQFRLRFHISWSHAHLAPLGCHPNRPSLSDPDDEFVTRSGHATRRDRFLQPIKETSLKLRKRGVDVLTPGGIPGGILREAK